MERNPVPAPDNRNPEGRPKSTWVIIGILALLLAVFALQGATGIAGWFFLTGFLLLLTALYALVFRRRTWASLMTAKHRKVALAGGGALMVLGVAAGAIAAPPLPQERPTAEEEPTRRSTSPVPSPGPSGGGSPSKSPSPTPSGTAPTSEAAIANQPCTAVEQTRSQGRVEYRCTEQPDGRLLWLDKATSERINEARKTAEQRAKLAEEQAQAERKAAEERAAAEKAAGEARAEAEQKAAEERSVLEKAAAEAQQKAEQKAAEEQAAAEAQLRADQERRAAEEEANRLAAEESEEARRLAEERAAADAAERQRLSDVEAQRLAEEERRLAEEEAAADAEAQRLAEEERRLAEEQAAADAAERQRLSDAETQRQAEEARRLAEEQAQPEPVPPAEPFYYGNCTDVQAAGAAPIYRGDYGWHAELDRDNDGVACGGD